MRVAVLGAGVNGVGSALAILQNVPDARVTIISEKTSPDTTGDGAAGLWGPHCVEGDPGKIAEWGRKTHDLLEHLWREGECPGIGLFSGLEVLEHRAEPWESVPFHCGPVRRAGEGSCSPGGGGDGRSRGEEVRWSAAIPQIESSEFQNSDQNNDSDVKYVTKPTNTTDSEGLTANEGRLCRIVTFYAEPTKLLQHLTSQYLALGGTFIKQKVTSLDEICSNYDVIVNCTGLGSHELAADHTMIPVRGQVLRVNAPFIKNFVGVGSTYAVPNDTDVVLGGTAQRADWNEQIHPDDSSSILERISQLIPSLKSAKIAPIRPWAGLRPYRPAGIRLEAEQRTSASGRRVVLVHNYGHGGGGMTLFWGCALEVVDIVKRCTQDSGLKSKL